MSAPTLFGLLLLDFAGAFCAGLAVARLVFRPPRARGVFALSAEELLGDIEAGLTRDGRDFDDAVADFSAGPGASENLPDRLSRLRETTRLSEQRLGRDHGRLARLAGIFPAIGRKLADELGRHRDRIGAFGTRLEGGELGQASAVAAALADLAVSNRALRAELQETRAKLESREAELAQAQREARVDSLTKLANRRSFEERLTQCQARLERDHEPYAVALFDLDRFKALNDRFGHAAGDAVLAVFASILRETVRSYDLPARFGGEEFAVLLPGTDSNGAAVVANRCRARAEQAVVRHGGEKIAFSVSCGVSAGRAERAAADTVAKADHALYAAKSAGRNRVLTEEAVESGEVAAHPAA